MEVQILTLETLRLRLARSARKFLRFSTSIMRFYMGFVSNKAAARRCWRRPPRQSVSFLSAFDPAWAVHFLNVGFS